MTYQPPKIIIRQERNHALETIEHRIRLPIPKAKEVSVPYEIGMETAMAIVYDIKDHFPSAKLQVAGSLRRKKQEIHDIDILIANPSDGIRAYVKDRIGEPLIDGVSKTSVLFKWHIGTFKGTPIQVDFRYIDPGSWGPAIQYFTGSREHNISLRRIAKERGWHLNEHGLFDAIGSRLDDNTEDGIYKALGLRWLPPEYRNDYIRHQPYVPKPTWCIDHQILDFCKRNRLEAKNHVSDG